MEIVTVIEQKVIEVSAETNGSIRIEKLPIVTVNVPEIEFGSDHIINILYQDVDPLRQHVVTFGDTQNLPEGIYIKKATITSNDNLLLQVANDGSGNETSPSFNLKLQVINF
jgi:hypothetical protein